MTPADLSHGSQRPQRVTQHLQHVAHHHQLEHADLGRVKLVDRRSRRDQARSIVPTSKHRFPCSDAGHGNFRAVARRSQPPGVRTPAPSRSCATSRAQTPAAARCQHLSVQAASDDHASRGRDHDESGPAASPLTGGHAECPRCDAEPASRGGRGRGPVLPTRHPGQGGLWLPMCRALFTYGGLWSSGGVRVGVVK